MKKTSAILLLLSILAISVFPLVPTTAENQFEAPPMQVAIYREMFAFDEDSAPMSSLPEVVPFNVDMVDAEGLSNDGEGVYVAVLDTGLLPAWASIFSQANIRDDLGIGFTCDIWWGGDGFYRGPLYATDFITDLASGHGTHVTSTIVGYNVFDSYWVKGVAPKATIIPVLVLDAWAIPFPGGTAYMAGGFFDMIATGIYYVADFVLPQVDGPVIISMSLGGMVTDPIIEDAIDYAISKGIIVVASAGNNGYDGMGWPGAYPQVISCGMAGWTEQFVSHWQADVPENLNTQDYWGNNWQIFLDDISSRPNMDLGQKHQDLDVTAPGSAVVGPYKPRFYPDPDFYSFYYLWGTSMAAPHVSGIAALILQDHPTYTQGAIESTLKTAANQIPMPADGAYVFDPFYADVYGIIPWYFWWFGGDWGSGFIQADTAINMASFFSRRFGPT
jgi:subtilisin family serine protease